MSTSAAPQIYHGVRQGEEAELVGTGNVWIVASKSDFDEISKFSELDDHASATRLINEKGITVPSGARVVMVDGPVGRFNDIQVKLLNGKYAGQIGWTWGVNLRAKP